MAPALLLFFCASVYAQTAAQRIALQHLNRATPLASPASLTEATTAPLSLPTGVTYDAAGNLYLADSNDHIIREVNLAGVISTVAGSGEQGYSGDGGPATSAMLDFPTGVAVDGSGTIYITDTHNQRIRKVVSGIITTIAGNGSTSFSGDGGPATAATLNLPTAVAVDAAGNVYFADTDNHRIRKITGTTISTVAGNGEQLYLADGVAATQTGLDSPGGLALDANGNLFIADTHNQRVRLVTAATGLISTVAGNGSNGFAGDGGAGGSAALSRPRGVAVAGTGNLYVADSDNNRVRNVNLNTDTITTLAGSGSQGFSGDTGPATSAMFDTPRSVAVSGLGTVAISDTHNQRVREILGADIETVAGQGGSGAASLVLSGPASIVFGSGTLIATLTNGAQTASGSIAFVDVTNGANPLGTGSLTHNVARISLADVSVGTHLFAATYPGDANTPAVTSGVFTVVVTSTQGSNDFAITATPSIQAVAPGGVANYSISLTAQGTTFGSAVSLRIAGVPSGSTAIFTPASIAAGAAPSASSLLSIQTSKQATLRSSMTRPFALPFALSLFLLPLFSQRRLRDTLRKPGGGVRLLAFLLLMLGTLSLSGCGSGGFFTQAPQTYTITVTAASAAVGPMPAVSHSTTVTLTIQ
ncbi:Ig-like domain repeat protein [Granulicella sp. S190]|uniref:NHL domain-containing protein n=1 Tax=Granulicella sp. S190 TaxID=1747226 RepID=UPI00131E820B|nr:Ig-like domain repeat protein [Granulicella sp. S190]